MARITVEDCLDNVDNRFQLVLVATKRARQISLGADPMVPEENDKATVIALREIAEGLVGPGILDEEDKVPELSPYDARLGTDFDLPPGAEREMPGSLFTPIGAGDSLSDGGGDGADDDTDAALIAALQREFSQNMFNDPDQEIPAEPGGMDAGAADQASGFSSNNIPEAPPAAADGGYLGTGFAQSSDMITSDNLPPETPGAAQSDTTGAFGTAPLGSPDPIASVEPVQPADSPAASIESVSDDDLGGLSASDAELLRALTAENFGVASESESDDAKTSREHDQTGDGTSSDIGDISLGSAFTASALEDPADSKTTEPDSADALFGGSFSSEPSEFLSSELAADSTTETSSSDSGSETADSDETPSTDESAYSDPTSRKDSSDLDN